VGGSSVEADAAAAGRPSGASTADLQGCDVELDIGQIREERPVTLHPLLLEILVCPDCKGALTVDATNSELVCDECGLIYPIRDGIPVMLVSAARRSDAGRPDELAVEVDAPGGAAPVEASDDDTAASETSVS
jgi:uncharacterized protein YbaR (Trm112 family)